MDSHHLCRTPTAKFFGRFRIKSSLLLLKWHLIVLQFRGEFDKYPDFIYKYIIKGAVLERKIHCPACHEEVEPIAVSMGTEGIERLRCPNCGAFLDKGKDEFSEALQEGEEFVFSDESISIPVFPSIYLVGYSERVGALIEEQILERNFARDVHSLSNGEDLIVRLIQNLNSLNHDDIGLVILEVTMPYLNGINAAIAMRAIERTYPAHNLIPILFLTHKGVDETFKKVIKFLSPAKYASLGSSEDFSKLAPRVNKIISLLAQEKW